MIADGWRKARAWLLAYPVPDGARPLAAGTEAANRWRFRSGWVDASYRTDLGPLAVLDALVARDGGLLRGTVPAQVEGTDGRFTLVLGGTGRAGGDLDRVERRREAKGRRVTGMGAPLPLIGRASRRRFDVSVPRSDGGESLVNPRLLAWPAPAEGGGSRLRADLGRSYQVARVAVMAGAVCVVSAPLCFVAWVIGGGGSGWLESAVILAAFVPIFAIAMVALGWRSDVAPSPLSPVLDAIHGTVVPTSMPAGSTERPPIASPYRR